MVSTLKYGELVMLKVTIVDYTVSFLHVARAVYLNWLSNCGNELEERINCLVNKCREEIGGEIQVFPTTQATELIISVMEVQVTLRAFTDLDNETR